MLLLPCFGEMKAYISLLTPLLLVDSEVILSLVLL